MAEPTLHVVTKGDDTSLPRIAFCHGLFGQGRNWTAISKAVSDVARPTLVDMPDHGRSPWSEQFDYVEMADAVADTLRAIDDSAPWIVVGHSMGGKASMIMALRHPDLVSRLCVVDVSPVAYREGREFEHFVTSMRGMELDAIETRQDADRMLAADVPDDAVRAFLLQNLRRDGDGWRWQMNLDVLGDSIGRLRGWPVEPTMGKVYEGPVLWISGETSGYVRDDMGDAMRGYFPRARLVTIKNAGHWVHSEQPEIFVEVLRRFVEAGRDDDGQAG